VAIRLFTALAVVAATTVLSGGLLPAVVQADPASPWREFFVWGEQYPGGARIWRDAQNLVELNLESAAVRDFVWGAPDSVVQSYLAQGVDGWRLDVGYDIGMAYLSELTRAAHARKPGSLVVGEIANYPKDWLAAKIGVYESRR
jgi:glycosidase